MQAVRVEAHVGVVREKERTAGADTDIEFDAIVSVSIAVVVALYAARPSFPIGDRPLGLSDPSRVIKTRRHGVCGRGNTEEIGDHHLVESDERMMNLPRPLRRPMPIQEITGRCLAIPVPLDRFPEFRDSATE